MRKMDRLNKNTRHIFLLCFVLFALSPCVIKASFFGNANLTYSKPLNKSKTTAQLNACQYSGDNKLQISCSQQVNVDKAMLPIFVFGNQCAFAYACQTNYQYLEIFSGNSPPKYILYKRLKLDMM